MPAGLHAGSSCPPTLHSAEFETRFAAVARTVAEKGSTAAMPTTLLDIGDEQTMVLFGRGEKPEAMHLLDLGALHIARTFFKHDPPASYEIEQAIDMSGMGGMGM